LIMSMLEKEPDRRPSSMADVLQVLERFLRMPRSRFWTAFAIPAVRDTPQPPAASPSAPTTGFFGSLSEPSNRRRRLTWGSAILAGSAVALATLITIYSDRAGTRTSEPKTVGPSSNAPASALPVAAPVAPQLDGSAPAVQMTSAADAATPAAQSPPPRAALSTKPKASKPVPPPRVIRSASPPPRVTPPTSPPSQTPQPAPAPALPKPPEGRYYKPVDD
jgi:hypothetical protein